MNMYRLSQPKSTRVFAALVYVVVITAAIVIADWRVGSVAAEQSAVLPGSVTVDLDKPFFALSSNRTFGSSENARLWLDHRGLNNVDFRVYRVNDPQRFFAQLNDTHEMGERESEQLAATMSQRPSLLERVRAVKVWAYSGIRNYFRDQLRRESRKSFNQNFRAVDTAKRVPLNVADYARVPLLNPNQLVTSWREPLPNSESIMDRRMIPLGKRDAGVYLVEAVNQQLRAYTIVVVTDLTMVEKVSANGEVLVYAVDRKSGQPQAETRVDIVRANKTVASGKTNSEGVFRTKIPEQEEEAVDDIDSESRNRNPIILASLRENFAISDLQTFYFERDPGENVQGYIYTDRPIYRPNHKVFFKGIVRARDEKNEYRAPKDDTVTVTITDSKSTRVHQQEIRLSKYGTFSGEFTLAEEAPLGTYNIEAENDEGGSFGNFEVAEYKKPEYKVKVTTPKQFVPAGSKTKFDINARYFFGAPVADAEVKYYIYRSRYYAYFGGEYESEHDSEDEEEYSSYGNYYSDLVFDGEGKLDASGQISVEFDVPQSQKDDLWDFQYRLEAQVVDSSRRSINATANVIATRGSVVAVATPERYVYNKGQTARIAVSTTDYQGRPISTKVSLEFMVRTWSKVEHKANEYDPDYQMREETLGGGDVTTDREGHAVYDFQVTGPGSISIRTVLHEAGKEYISLGGFIWSAALPNEWSDSRFYNESLHSIKLVADKKSYRQGETARVLAILPHENADLLVTTELDNVLSARYVKATGKTIVLDVPIEKNYAPNVYVSVTFVKDGDMYSSDQRLVVPARDKMLNLEIISNKKEYKPRETASYTILARDADGAPVPDAEVSLGVVDEAIYSISPDYSGNIRKQFYGMRYNSVQTHLSIAYYFRGVAGEKPIDLASTKPSYQLADFKNESNQVQPMIRKEFKDTAYWEPSAVTGRDGRATVKFRLPDNLTTWRATARGVTTDTMVGSSNHKVISRKDVILRLETPRFLTQGDTVTLSGIVHNYLKEAKSTQISISVTGARLISPAQQTVNIEKQGEHRVDWQISAPQTGQIRLLAKALTNIESDAVELALDVIPRGLREHKAESWSSSDDNAQQEFSLNLPANTDLNSRKLRIEVAPSVAGTLFGALDYLTTFPYGCTEQTMSSFLPNIIVSQTVKEFRSASIRNNEELKKKVEQGRNRLYSLQHNDGGWGWWTNDKTDPFMTAYVVDGLTLAKQAGYEIDDERLARGRESLQQLLDTGLHNLEERAFVTYALAESGGVDSKHVDSLYAARGGLLPYGRALLALTLSIQKMDQRAQEVAVEIERSANLGKTSAHWQSKRNPEYEYSENSIEGTALSLKALARIKPDSLLLAPAARWLVTERSNGYYWSSTKDTAFAIFGLIDYVKVSSELTPSYDVEVYLNGETVVAQHIDDATGQAILVNRTGARVGETNHVRVVKRGKGTLYLSASIEYYKNDEHVYANNSADLEITREYRRLKIEREGSGLKWSMSPLTGEIQSGDLIVVQLRLRGKPARRLLLEDPIPAGAEQIEHVGNLDLTYVNGGWTDWYSSREFRDRRTVYFLDRFDGDAKFQYAFRVQVPGEFVVAPARVELMYEPSTYANSASGRFVFLDRPQRVQR
jgi:uncharacterized protein YfaS (alpha-2-macroglobulin family)